MTEPVVVACCQVEVRVGDVAGNLARAGEAVQRAAARGARLVVLPELLASGYVFTGPEEARALAEDPRTGPTATALLEWARRFDLLLVSGVCELDDDGLVRNSAIVVDATGVLAVYRKVHLWDAESLVFTPGEEPPPVLETPFGRLSVMICYDLEFPEWVRVAALAGAEVLAVPTNWPRGTWPDGERPGELHRAQAAASTNRIWVVACDRAGVERGVDWIGGASVVDPDGFPVGVDDEGRPLSVGAPSEPSRPRVVTAAVDAARARDKNVSARNHVLDDRRDHLYSRLADPHVVPAP